MAVRKAPRDKFYTAAEANAALPLVRAIVGDIAALARDMQERHDRLERLQDPGRGPLGDAYREELEQATAEFERQRENMHEFEDELKKLGVELKDYHTGLIDFRCRLGDREVYLCWRLGEPEVAHWHELDAGFAGRQKLPVPAGRKVEQEIAD